MNLARLLTHTVSRLAGLVARLRPPRFLRAPLWHAFARAYGIRADEAAKPLAEYPTFLALFTRRLRPDARPIAAAEWVAPVDAWWLTDQAVDGDTCVPVKGNSHRLTQLLDNPGAASAFAGGRIGVFYLRPGDYHRIHSPTAWTINTYRHVPGVLWPVNRLGQRVPGLFGINERWIFAGHNAHGPLAMVWVGALMVGSIALHHEGLMRLAAGGAPVTVAAGDELGAFYFGSTVIVVRQAPAQPVSAVPGEIRMGQAIWVAP